MDELVIGKVHGPHGTRGEVSVTSTSGETAHFLSIKSIKVRTASSERFLDIESIQEGPRGLILRFAGIDSPEEAATLLGAELVVPRDKAAPLGKDEFYAIDLVGCELVSGGKTLATVLSVIEGSPADFLEARKEDGSVSLVPFRKEFVGTVDLSARRVELLAPWILE